MSAVSSRERAPVDARAMKPFVWMFAAAGLVTGASLWLEINDIEFARQKLVFQVEQLRPFLHSRFEATPDPETIECVERFADLDFELNRLAPWPDASGANRAPLFARDPRIGVVLDDLAQLAAEREGKGSLPYEPKMSMVFHRTDFFCVAALAETDDARARMRFEQAFALLLLADDGGALAFSYQRFGAGTICREARRRAERHGQDPELVRSLRTRFESASDCGRLPERIARDMVRNLRRPHELEVPCIASFQRWTREAELIHAVLTGALAPERLRAMAEAEGLCFIGLFYCDPQTLAIRGGHLRL